MNTLRMKSHYGSVQFSHSVMSDSLRPHESKHSRPPCPSPTPGVYSNSCPLSRWCHPAISSSVVPFSSCPQSLPASASFPKSWLFTWGGQSIGVSCHENKSRLMWCRVNRRGMSILERVAKWHLWFNCNCKDWVGKEVDASKELNWALHGWSIVSMVEKYEKRLGGVEQGGVPRFRALKLKDVYSLEGNLWPTWIAY